ncbi:hypothetical protein M3Y99_01361800 [Aphelenchoides fujianensis]|nr:hypothetical protein M3Y99_01361800 [Aphelenchoides fujianensis]
MPTERKIGGSIPLWPLAAPVRPSGSPVDMVWSVLQSFRSKKKRREREQKADATNKTKTDEEQQTPRGRSRERTTGGPSYARERGGSVGASRKVQRRSPGRPKTRAIVPNVQHVAPVRKKPPVDEGHNSGDNTTTGDSTAEAKTDPDLLAASSGKRRRSASAGAKKKPPAPVPQEADGARQRRR